MRSVIPTISTLPTLAESSFLAVFSLLFFFALFVGIVVWLLATGKSGRWQRDARIPLDDDHPITPRPTKPQDTRHV